MFVRRQTKGFGRVSRRFLFALVLGSLLALAGGGSASGLVHGPSSPDVALASADMAKYADSSTALAGGINGYTISISNSYGFSGYVTIQDTLPAGFSYLGPTSGTNEPTTVKGRTIIWTNVYVPANSSAAFHFRVRVASTPGTYYNSAARTGGNFDATVNPTGPTAPITVLAPLTLSKTADAPTAAVGTSDGYTIMISNPSQGDVTLNLFDDLPNGFSYISGSTTGAPSPIPTEQRLTWNGIRVLAGTTTSIHFKVTVSSIPGTYYNNVSGSSSEAQVDPTGPTAPIDVTPAQLTMTKTADSPSAQPGSADGYTIAVSNPNGSAANVTIYDDLPAGFSYTPASTSGATTANPGVSGQRLTWSGITVPANGSASIHFRVTVSSVPGSYTNSASGSASGNTVGGASATIAVVAVQEQPPPAPAPPPPGALSADLAVTRTVSTDNVVPGIKVTYTFRIRNAGPNAASNVVFTVNLGAGLAFVSANASQGSFALGSATAPQAGCSGTGPIRCPLGGLANGASANVIIVARAKQSGPLGTAGDARSDEADPAVGNNIATAAVAFLPPPVPGKKVNAVPVSGTVLVNGKRLKSPDQIRVGATLDTTKGEVRLITKNGDANFHDGIFVLRQEPSKDAVTELVLKGGILAAQCKKTTHLASLTTPLKAKKPTRQLWGKGKGRFRTRGRYSSATVRGTHWLVQDRCDGTLTVVKSGTVLVRDFILKKNVVVRKGQKYLAGPRLSKGQHLLHR